MTVFTSHQKRIKKPSNNQNLTSCYIHVLLTSQFGPYTAPDCQKPVLLNEWYMLAFLSEMLLKLSAHKHLFYHMKLSVTENVN